MLPNVDNTMSLTKPVVTKERKKHDRFNGLTDEEVSKRTLPDYLTENLDIIIVSVTFIVSFLIYNSKSIKTYSLLMQEIVKT